MSAGWLPSQNTAHTEPTLSSLVPKHSLNICCRALCLDTRLFSGGVPLHFCAALGVPVWPFQGAYIIHLTDRGRTTLQRSNKVRISLFLASAMYSSCYLPEWPLFHTGIRSEPVNLLSQDDTCQLAPPRSSLNTAIVFPFHYSRRNPNNAKTTLTR